MKKDESRLNLVGKAPAESVTLTRKQLAGCLQLSGKTVGRLVAKGELPKPVMFGRSARWSRTVIVQMVADGSRPPSALGLGGRKADQGPRGQR